MAAAGARDPSSPSDPVCGPRGLIGIVSDLEREMAALRERCASLESECGDLRACVESATEAAKAEEEANQHTIADLTAQVQDLACRLGGGSGALLPKATGSPAPSAKPAGGIRFVEEPGESDKAASDPSMRSSRQRKGTAMPSKAEIDEVMTGVDYASDRRLQFDDSDTIVEQASTVRGAGRPAKSRQNTAFAPAPEPEAREGGVQFDDNDTVLEQTSTVRGPGRSAKSRQNTAFAPAAETREGGVQFDDTDTVLEQASTVRGAGRPAKARQNTAFAPAPAAKEGGVSFEQEEDDNDGSSQQASARSKKKRVPTAFAAPMGNPLSDDDDD